MKTTSIILLALAILASSCLQHPTRTQLNARDVFTTANLPSTKFEISGDADTILVSGSGMKIFIPKEVFTDAHGASCSGPVTLELKEALTAADMVLGNMTTLSNGKILQSGGMIYINAKQGDQQLAIGDGKSIAVSVPTTMKSDSMKIYSSTFDSTSRQFNWINPEDRMFNIRPDSLACFSCDTVKTNSAEEMPAKKPEFVLPPVKPHQSSNTDTIFSLIFDTAAFPEFAQYRNVKFRLVENNNFTSKDSEITWHKMQLEKTNKENVYIITFTCFTEEGEAIRKYKVSPVYTGTDYETAMKDYNRKFASYEQKKKEIEEKRIEAARQQRLAQEKAQAEQKKQQMETRYNGINYSFSDPAVNYVFSLNKLGWANIDCLYGSPGAKPVDIQTLISSEESYESIYISLLFDKEKIYIQGYQKKDHSFCFSHNDYENMILPVGATAVLMATAYKDGQLHFVSKRITIADKMEIVLNPIPIKQEELKEMVVKSI